MENMELSNYQGRKTRIRTELKVVTDSFIVIGYELKQIRDNEEYKLDGYATIADFAKAEYNLSQSTTSKFISINEKYSVNGNSPELMEEYKGYEHTKLSDMLSLKDDEEQLVTVHTTRAEIKEIKDARKEAINAEYSSRNIAESIENTQSEVGFEHGEKYTIPGIDKSLIKFFRDKKRRDILKQLAAVFTGNGILSESMASEIINPSQYLLFQDGLVTISFQETTIKYKKAFGAVIDYTYNDFIHDIRLTFDMTAEDPALEFYGEPEPDPIPEQKKEVEPPKVETKKAPAQKTTSKPEAKTTAKPIITQPEDDEDDSEEDDNETEEDSEESEEETGDDIPGQAVIEDYPELLPEVTESVVEDEKVTDIVTEHQVFITEDGNEEEKVEIVEADIVETQKDNRHCGACSDIEPLMLANATTISVNSKDRVLTAKWEYLGREREKSIEINYCPVCGRKL